MHTWDDAHAAGVETFYVTPDGQLRMRQQGLSKDQLAAARRHRHQIVAEWLWTLADPLPTIAWDEDLAHAILSVAAQRMDGPSLSPHGDWALVHLTEAQLMGVWSTHSIAEIVRASQRWLTAVKGLQQIP